MKKDKTIRGFNVRAFTDRYEKECSLQESSAIGDYEDSWDKPGSSCVWLGVNENRMHLDREMVDELISALKEWRETGSLK